ncbi:MAG: hypothetical protein ACRC35_00900 [Angustibacter sp.]
MSSDLALEFWTLPWLAVRGIADAVARTLRWLPLAGLAWKARFVLAVIGRGAVRRGRPSRGGGVHTDVRGGYGERAWAGTIRDLGDDRVRRAGLADALDEVEYGTAESPGHAGAAQSLIFSDNLPSVIDVG